MTGAPHRCETPGCGNHRGALHEVCSECWRRLPADLRARLSDAMRHGKFIAKAAIGMEARRWLAEHTPAATMARICGDPP